MHLTQRERQVFQLLKQGWSTRGVAQHLFVSEKTVRNHVSNAMKKNGFQGQGRYEFMWALKEGGEI